jgi:SAM-dependent methyltransferase
VHYDGWVPTSQKLLLTIRQWWKQHSAQHGIFPTLRNFHSMVWEFLSESTPARRKQRYGDVDYDWEYRVDTTAATVSLQSRLTGVFHSPYQPTEPLLFRKMLDNLSLDFREFIFIDVGSGKGRALLMAADFPFRRILGIELLPELHHIAQENINKFVSESQQCFAVESVCADAREFLFPSSPTLLYLFNPLPEAGLRQLVANLEKSLHENPRPVYLLYHNPLLDHVLAQSPLLKKLQGTSQFVVYRERTSE